MLFIIKENFGCFPRVRWEKTRRKGKLASDQRFSQTVVLSGLWIMYTHENQEESQVDRKLLKWAERGGAEGLNIQLWLRSKRVFVPTAHLVNCLILQFEICAHKSIFHGELRGLLFYLYKNLLHNVQGWYVSFLNIINKNSEQEAALLIHPSANFTTDTSSLNSSSDKQSWEDNHQTFQFTWFNRL